MVAVNEALRAHTFLAFHLQLANFERAAVGESHQQSAAFDAQASWLNQRKFRHGLRCMDVQGLSAESGKRSRPGLESAQAVPGLYRRARKIDESVLLLQDRRQ